MPRFLCLSVLAVLLFAGGVSATSKAGLRAGLTEKKNWRGRNFGLAFGLTVESKIDADILGGLAIDIFSVKLGDVQNTFIGATYVVKGDIRPGGGTLAIRPGVGFGLGLGHEAGESSKAGCLRLSVEFSKIPAPRMIEWLAEVGFMAYGGKYNGASPMPFLRVGFMK